MYDGYYIYSPYTNELDDVTQNEVINENGQVELKTDAEILGKQNEDATYHDGDKISGIKPYIYYSCRYKYDGNDFTITYSLDNYITIQGIINIQGTPQWVYDYGYLLDNISGSGNNFTYRGIKIEANEHLSEWVYDPNKNDVQKYEYIQINGVKYYKDGNSWFSILNGRRYDTLENFNPQTTAAIEYYKDALEFTNRVKSYGLEQLTTDKAVNERGSTLYEIDEEGREITSVPKFGSFKIFDFGGADSGHGSIEDPDSNFNQHRLDVIRYCIEKELSIAIANYNNYSGVTTNFQMPKLDEEDWDQVVNDVSLISFLQGLSIGGKVYNGYSIVSNNNTEEVIKEDSIYMLTNDNRYHSSDENALAKPSNNNSTYIVSGYLDRNFDIKTIITGDGRTLYYMSQQDKNNPILGSYTSIINKTDVAMPDNMYEYIANVGGTLATKYFTALGRERYGVYRINNDADKMKIKFGMQ